MLFALYGLRLITQEPLLPLGLLPWVASVLLAPAQSTHLLGSSVSVGTQESMPCHCIINSLPLRFLSLLQEQAACSNSLCLWLQASAGRAR